MSIKIAALVFVAAFSVNSCNDNNIQNVESPSKNTSDTFLNQQSKPTDTIKEEKSIEQFKSKPDSITEIVFAKGLKSLSVKGRLNKPGDVVTYILTVVESTKLIGRIDAFESSANIRFNQIVMPNGQSDGPFGKQFEYALSQKGVYKIKIGHNLMAENAFVGDFLFYLTVQ